MEAEFVLAVLEGCKVHSEDRSVVGHPDEEGTSPAVEERDDGLQNGPLHAGVLLAGLQIGPEGGLEFQFGALPSLDLLENLLLSAVLDTQYVGVVLDEAVEGVLEQSVVPVEIECRGGHQRTEHAEGHAHYE